jgi:osmotically-inducible protein OsmY
VQLRTLGTFAASFGVWIGSTAAAAEPAKMPVAPKAKTEQTKATTGDAAANKKLVDAIAAKLKDSEAAADTDLEFSASSGAVTIKGTVGSATQKTAILEIVRRVDGVKVVKDGLNVVAAKSIASTPQFSPTSINEPMKVPDLTKVEPAKATEPVMKPVDLKAANQKLASTVMAQLKASGTAGNSDLDILANNGTVTVVGTTGSEPQKMAILDVVRRVDGVMVVKDGVQTKAAPKAMNTGIMPVQAVGPVAMNPPSAVPPAGMPGNPIIDPVPVGPGGGLDGAAPPLPPNAWPTYAPYNNLSRVAYPTAYPYNAFPFIGPYYPFPKVPLGWRKVTLEWEDGHWWLGRKQAPIDYWRVKFGY